jgi:hypothetical protein
MFFARGAQPAARAHRALEVLAENAVACAARAFSAYKKGPPASAGGPIQRLLLF